MERGSIVKFHTHLPGEDVNQEFVLLETFPAWTQEFKNGTSQTYPAKANIQALNTGMNFPGISSVALGDLVEVDNVNNYDLSYLKFS